MRTADGLQYMFNNVYLCMHVYTFEGTPTFKSSEGCAWEHIACAKLDLIVHDLDFMKPLPHIVVP